MRSKAGRTGSLNFPECVLGEGSAPRRTGSDFSRFAPSPPSLPAHAPAPCLEAGWGAGGDGGGTFCTFGAVGGGKLANEGQKGLGEENYFFKTFLRQTAPGDRPLRPSPPRFPGAPTHPPSEPLPTPIRGLVATPRRRNRTSSHVSRVSRGPPRPSPTARRAPSAGLRVRAPGSMRRGALAGRPAPERPGFVRAGQGAGAPGWPPGGPFGSSSRFGTRGVLFIMIIFLTARPTRGRARRAPRCYWGAEAASRGLLACGTTARRRAAILSPWLLSLGGWGGSGALRHCPDGPGRGGSRRSRPRGPPVVP